MTHEGQNVSTQDQFLREMGLVADFTSFDYENEASVTTLYTSEKVPDYALYRTDLSGIVFTQKSDKCEVDLTDFAPKGTEFKTYGGVAGRYSKYDSGMANAEMAWNGENAEIYLNPSLFEYRGGSLIVLHEIGHAWQREADMYAEGPHTRAVLLGKVQEDAIDLKRMRELLLQQEEIENDAWRYALSVYEELKGEGVNLAPLLTEREIARYPQSVYDLGYNRDIPRTIQRLGVEIPEGFRPRIEWKG